MKDWLVGLIAGVIIGGLIVFIFLSKSTYTDQEILITVTKWEKKLVDNPVPCYIPSPAETVLIADTTKFGDLPVCYMRKEEKIPFSVNDSNFALPFAVKTHYKGWIRDMSIETYETEFLYEVKMRKSVDWKWCFLAFAVGALSMRAVDAIAD